MIQCVFVGLGGFLGAVFRYLLGLIPLSAQLRIPVITLGINVLGACDRHDRRVDRQDTGPKS